MTRPIVQEIDVITGEVTVREMNDAEYEQHLTDKAEFEARQALEG